MKPAAGTFGGTHASPPIEKPKPKPGAVQKAFRDIGRPLLAFVVFTCLGMLTALGVRIWQTWPDDPPKPPYYKTFTGRLGE